MALAQYHDPHADLDRAENPHDVSGLGNGDVLLLVATIVAGLATTVLGNITGHPHDYRQTVAPYFRSIFYFQPRCRLDHQGPDWLPNPRHARLGAVRRVALHPPGARVLGAAQILDPAVHRLPLARGYRARGASSAAWVGTDRPTEPAPRVASAIVQKLSLDAVGR